MIKHESDFYDNLLEPKEFDTEFLLGGSEYYINCLQETFLGYDMSLSISAVESILKKELEYLIKKIDDIHFHNPCGLPIKVKTIKYKKTFD